jgi:phage shock protein C
MAVGAGVPENICMTYTEQPPGGPVGPGVPRSLHRSTSNRMVAGIAGGLAEYLDVDPLVVRIGFVAASLLTGGIGGPLVYLVAWLAVPEDGKTTSIASETLGAHPWSR